MYELSFWERVKNWFEQLWDWWIDLFNSDVEKEYKALVNKLILHLAEYIMGHKTIDVEQMQQGSHERCMAEKHNAALSLYKAVVPDACVRGQQVECVEHSQVGFFHPGKTKPRQRQQGKKPVREWFDAHQPGAYFEARDLNYHRTAMGRFFQRVLGKEWAPTKTTRLLHDVMETEDMRL